MQRLFTIDDNRPPHPDCFVIPSYAVKNQSIPTKPTRAQIELAYEWWKKFPRAKLIMSTGDNQFLGVTNAKVMKAYAVSLGVPPGNVIEEDQSQNTYENLVYSKKIIDREKFQQPTLVTLDLYTKRAVAIAKKLGWTNFYWLSVTSAGEPAYGYKWLQTHSRFTIFVYELCAMIYGKMVGWV